ncbi:MAG: Vitamin B12-binding protein [candidate division WS2 bacterium]|uniref:Vitamin B12-binding protein n=1 Tax=Psychracetigena formicireducens TaxID=2986056 RepID=A0A9E2BMY2_PSYF1|nr:Vitamin B12-binding protein [Candidatus Psychracetigena formicireducens]
MKRIIDQIGREENIPDNPHRIISLVPSITDLLFHLGLENEVVGITKFCEEPPKALQTKKIVGGTKNVHFDVIDQLQPDLVIGTKEENTLEMVSELEKKYPVFVTNVPDFNAGLRMIELLASIFQKKAIADKMLYTLKNEQLFIDQYQLFKGTTCLYVIWKKPYMLAGRNTYIHSMLNMIGFENLSKMERYPTIELDEIIELKPDYLLLSSEPYPFKEKDAEVFKEFLPNTKVVFADGKLFSWYGPQMLKFFNAIKNKTLWHESIS